MATKAKSSTDIAVAPEAEENRNLPSTDVIDMSDYAGMGREETRAEDYSIPFLRILQKGSPEVDESEGKYIKDAKPGDFLNTVSGHFYSGKVGLKMIPCLFHREYVEWVPRDKGGGFVANYQSDDPIVATAKAGGGKNKFDLMLPNGNQLVDTYYEYVMCGTPDGDVFQAVLSFTSTQTKKVRKWNSLQGQKRLDVGNGRILSDPPSFAFYYHVTTVGEKNDLGTWYGWHVDDLPKPGNQVPAAEFREALQFYKQVKSGGVKRAAEVSDDAAAGDSDYIPGSEGQDDKSAF